MILHPCSICFQGCAQTESQKVVVKLRPFFVPCIVSAFSSLMFLFKSINWWNDYNKEWLESVKLLVTNIEMEHPHQFHGFFFWKKWTFSMAKLVYWRLPFGQATIFSSPPSANLQWIKHCLKSAPSSNGFHDVKYQPEIQLFRTPRWFWTL